MIAIVDCFTHPTVCTHHSHILINDQIKINMNLPKQDQSLGVRKPYLTFHPNT